MSGSLRLQKRNQGLDALRVFAAISVVIIHISAPVTTSEALLANAGLFWWSATFLDSFARFSVPAFVVFTGYGAYRINALKEDDASFLKFRKQLVKVSKVAVFWSVVFIAWTLTRGDYSDSSYLMKMWLGIVKPMIAGRPYFHLWYFFMVIPLLFLVPYLVGIISKIDQTKSLQLLCGSALFCLMFSLQNYYYENQLLFLFWFLEYLFYFLFGYFLSTFKWRVNKRILFAALIICMTANALLTFYTIDQYGARRGQYFFDFVSPLVLIQTVCMFLLFVGMKVPNFLRLTNLATFTLGVYVVHPFITDPLRHIVIGSSSVFLMLGAIIFSVLGSVVLVVILKRVRFLNEFV